MPGRLHQVNTPHIPRNSGARVGMVTHQGSNPNNGVTCLRPVIRPNHPHNSGVIIHPLRHVIRPNSLRSNGAGLELGGTRRKALVSNGVICQDQAHQCKGVEVVCRDTRIKHLCSNSNNNSSTLDKPVGIIWQDEELTDEVDRF